MNQSVSILRIHHSSTQIVQHMKEFRKKILEEIKSRQCDKNKREKNWNEDIFEGLLKWWSLEDS